MDFVTECLWVSTYVAVWLWIFTYIVVCSSMLQCDSGVPLISQRVAVWLWFFPSGAVCCSVSAIHIFPLMLQCVAVSLWVSPYSAVCGSVNLICAGFLFYVAVCCSVLQCVAVWWPTYVMCQIWMRHVLPVDESRCTYEWVSSTIRMGHVTRMNE